MAGGLGVVTISIYFYIPDSNSVRKPASGAMLLASWGGSGLCFLQTDLSWLPSL